MLEARSDKRSLEMWSRAEFDRSESERKDRDDEGEFGRVGDWARKIDAAGFEDAQAGKTSRGKCRYLGTGA